MRELTLAGGRENNSLPEGESAEMRGIEPRPSGTRIIDVVPFCAYILPADGSRDKDDSSSKYRTARFFLAKARILGKS